MSGDKQGKEKKRQNHRMTNGLIFSPQRWGKPTAVQSPTQWSKGLVKDTGHSHHPPPLAHKGLVWRQTGGRCREEWLVIGDSATHTWLLFPLWEDGGEIWRKCVLLQKRGGHEGKSFRFLDLSWGKEFPFPESVGHHNRASSLHHVSEDQVPVIQASETQGPFDFD